MRMCVCVCVCARLRACVCVCPSLQPSACFNSRDSRQSLIKLWSHSDLTAVTRSNCSNTIVH